MESIRIANWNAVVRTRDTRVAASAGPVAEAEALAGVPIAGATSRDSARDVTVT